MKKIKVVILIKYFYPLKIVSGNTGFYKQLLPKLNRFLDLNLITYNKSHATKEEVYQGYKVHRVRFPFMITAPLLARSLKPDYILFATGMHKLVEHLPYSIIFRVLTAGYPLILQQNVLISPFLRVGLSCFRLLYDVTFCVGPGVKKQMDLYRVKAILTPTGINLENIKNLRKINKNSDLRIGFFGQYSYNKSPLDLLDCFLELSPVNAELFMAAENINLFKEKFLYKKVKGNNNIIMKGYLDDIYSYINSCDIVVVPFISDYGVLGLDQTVIDSMSLGKVVIGYSSVTIRPLIAHGDDGFLYKNKDELKRYLNILIRNPTLRKSMGTKAQKKIMTYYNIDKTVEKIYRIFRTFQRN